MSDIPPPRPPKVSGQLFSARLEFLRRAYGEATITRVLEALGPEDRERLRGLDASQWYPFRTLVRFDRIVAQVVAPDDPEIFGRLGGASARLLLSWLGRDAPLMSPHALLSRVAEDHGRRFSFGTGEYRRTGFGEGELVFSGYPETDEVFCRSSRGYVRACVEFLTGRRVEVEEPECQCRGDGRCLYRVRWQARPGSGQIAVADA